MRTVTLQNGDFPFLSPQWQCCLCGKNVSSCGQASSRYPCLHPTQDGVFVAKTFTLRISSEIILVWECQAFNMAVSTVLLPSSLWLILFCFFSGM